MKPGTIAVTLELSDKYQMVSIPKAYVPLWVPKALHDCMVQSISGAKCSLNYLGLLRAG